MQLYLMKCKYPLAFSFMQFGYEKCEPTPSFGPVIRDFYGLHYILSGKGYREAEGKRTPLKKGDFFLVPKGREVKYYADPSDPYEYQWVGFTGINDWDILSEAGFGPGQYVLHRESLDLQVREIFERGKMLRSGKSLHDCLEVASICYEILGLLLPEASEEETEEESGLNAVIDYIEANICDVTLTKLEKVAHMHRSNLYRLFMRHYRIPPSEYIQNARLEKSLYLLKNTDSSVKQIASMTGWKTAAYFCKVFKQRYKKTPSEARMLK